MCKCISLASQTISVCIRASVDALCRDGTDMRGNEKASKLHECVGVSFLRHLVKLYGAY